MILQKKLLESLFTTSRADLFQFLHDHLATAWFTPFTLWHVDNSICEPMNGKYLNAEGRYDIYDFGYDNKNLSREKRTLEYFDEQIEIENTFFFRHMDSVYGILTFHGDVEPKMVAEMNFYADYIGQRLSEIQARESNISVYVDYQKKIEFVKQSSRILQAVEIDEVIAVALSFFMDVFSAEAGCAIHEDEFQGFGVERDDIISSISVEGKPLHEDIKEMYATEFIDSFIECEKFNIDNIFYIYEESMKIRILLFNIHFDVIPDKEFSELVSTLVSTAVENAQYHRKMTLLKVQESEMSATGEILNKFVNKTLDIKSQFEVHGINYPARSAGGDYLIVKESDDHLFFCVADVCGKGYSAAVFTVVLSVFTENSIMFAGKGSLAELVTRLNDYLLGKNFGDRFITAFFGYIDKKSNKLTYLSCGHEPALLYGAEEDSTIKSDFLPIGLMPELYEEKSVTLKEGDALFVYTDGLIEYCEEEDLHKRVKQLAKSDGDNILDTLYEELVTDKEAQKDDFTGMVIRI